MTESITARALITEISDQFDDRGWRDVGNLALKIAQQAQGDGHLEPGRAARLAGSEFLAQNGATVTSLEAMLTNLFADRLLQRQKDLPSQGNQSGNKKVEIGAGATLTNVTLHLDDKQMNISVGSSKVDLEVALAAMLSGVLDGQREADELLTLDEVAGRQRDLSVEEVESVAAAVIAKAEPEPSRLVQLRDRIIEAGATGVIVQGILAAIGLG